MTTRDGLAEFTLKAVGTGVVLGIVFGAANAYLGLRVGLTVSASIPAAVMTVAVFKLLRARGTILEANTSQTVASASTSLATGTIFTIPALFLWGVVPPYWQVVALALLGGLLGICAMIPLRRLLIVQSHRELPYPEGTACAEVLRATAADEGRVAGASTWIFRGIAVGAAVKVAISALYLFPDELVAPLALLPRAELALEVAPALIGVGYILGYRQSAVCVAGALISAVMITPLIAWLGAGLSTPLYPETTRLVSEMSAGDIWSKYVRYIGAGAVAVAGILTVIRGLPAMYSAFAGVARGVRGGAGGGAALESAREVPAGAAYVAGLPRTDHDLSGRFVLGGVLAVVLLAGLVPGIFGGGLDGEQRAVLAAGVGVFGVLFVAVAARIVGLVGVSSQPTSGIALVTLLGIATVFATMGWVSLEARAAVLTVGTVVAIAASKAGDISQDLKTGWLVGATPWRQQVAQLVGLAFACWAVAATVLLLGNAYEFGSQEIPAPQAMLMKTIVEGVLAGSLPWDLVLTGGGLAIGAMLCGVSGLAFAIGVYLPLAAMAPLYVGGCVRALVERRRGPQAAGDTDPGILAASGLVAGEGLAGVVIAALVAGGIGPKALEPRMGGLAGEVLGLVVVLAVCAFLLRSAGGFVRRPGARAVG
ncbi:MAG: oligopeptide transporter, OPT family [Steroidobacteraceae bacterium]|jgi:putative OPT family oligopeptide transporter|nr:oligopeptide transporter, OPT family [Steroidobacteraceae bacterium]